MEILEHEWVHLAQLRELFLIELHVWIPGLPVMNVSTLSMYRRQSTTGMWKGVAVAASHSTPS